eukprot:5843780-Alexandrium_andersonii.AAC.1
MAYADDTVVISKVAWVATRALQLLQGAARDRGLHLNMSKTKEIPMNSSLRISFLGGGLVPKVKSV